MKQTVVFFSLLIFFFIGFSQDTIREEVWVDWWVVPLFAIDEQGNSINDLTPENLELWVNGHSVSDYSLYKRSFTMVEKVEQGPEKPVLDRRKLIFFLFDLAFSNLENLERSKRVAESIVNGTSDECQFSIFVIDPYAGLQYLAGPSTDKSTILNIIRDKVILNTNAKNFNTIIWAVTQAQVGRESAKMGESLRKYTPSDMAFLLEDKMHTLKNTNRKYFRSFEALYFALSAISDNKFVYLFSEGISLYARQSIRHEEQDYRTYIHQTADLLGRSGAVLFIINPAGAFESLTDPGSGEDPLRLMALESGGKYMEGEATSLSSRIENLHRAYYEIAFAEVESFRGKVRKINITCKRKGVKIHTLHSMEKRKPYGEMNDLERQIFAINLINRNPFFSKGLNLMEVSVREQISKKDREIFRISLPENWLQNEVDIFKIRMGETDSDLEVFRSSLIPRKKEMDIEFESGEKSRHYFVLYNRQKSSALIRGIGPPKQEIPDFEKIPEIKAMSEQFKYSPELSGLLIGAANYCEKLKQAAFHYFCREKVVESLSIFKPMEVSDISFYENRASQTDMMRRNEPKLGFKRRKVSKYLFDYQIIKDEREIREQRKLISKKSKKDGSRGVEFRIKNFISEKAVFSPVTLLAWERQSRYEFKFIKYEKWNGIRCAVIEVLPRNKDDARFVYGQVWVDTSDHSVLKIRANPRSIMGYNKLEFQARKLMAKLFLNLEIHFNVVHEGIRFPNTVILSELYKGGPLITRHMGAKGWERLRTEYSYQDYKFFVVGTRVSAEE